MCRFVGSYLKSGGALIGLSGERRSCGECLLQTNGPY